MSKYIRYLIYDIHIIYIISIKIYKLLMNRKIALIFLLKKIIYNSFIHINIYI